LWRGVVRSHLHFVTDRSVRTGLAWGFITYALFYPAVALANHLTFPRMPTFGVPCPTAILTAGLLMLARQPRPWGLAIIPIIWTVVGGFAAFELGVRADLAL